MGFILEDGQGSGQKAGVTPSGRLRVVSDTFSADAVGSLRGVEYILATGIITLSGVTEAGILFLKNSDPNRILVVTSIAITTGKSNASGDVITSAYINPTGGTLLDGPNNQNALINNLNFGSITPALATAKRPTTPSAGLTITGGTLFNQALTLDGFPIIISGSPGVLPNGASVAQSITPPAGNTGMKVAITVSMLYVDPNDF